MLTRPSKGNLYLFDGPEDDVLLDWDAAMSEQPKNVLDTIKKGGLYLNEYETGEQLYRRLSSKLGSDIAASMKLNELGIPGHRFWDELSRLTKSGTHNFVIWNTDTLRLLGLTDDSEQDAQDYFKAEDYSNAYLDSLDNDSDVLDYSDSDYDYDTEHFDDIANAHLDALDNDGFYETYSQSARDNPMNSNNTVRAVDDFLTPEARRQIELLRKKYQGTPQWLKTPNGQDTNLTELQWLLIRTPNFKNWFGDWEFYPQNSSKIIDENGEPLVVYHGTGRADRVGSIFRKDRATSGPMAFFTDSRNMAEGYSKSKADTSLSREDLREYKNQFVIVRKGRNGSETYITLPDYWYMLPASKRAHIAAIAPTITIDEDEYDDDDWYKIISKPGNKIGMGGYDLHIREAHGNHLAALIEEWLNSANLFGKEKKFLDVLKLVGLDNVTYRDPDYREEAVYPVFMNMRHPFNTSNISQSDFQALRRSAVAAQRHFDPRNAYDSDAWDKTNISPSDWIDHLQENINDGSTTAWTTIPDFVTSRLKRLGYDGIKDTGGKYHKDKHNVYIPFEPIQLKSSERNNGEYSTSNQEIYKQAIGEIGAQAIDRAKRNTNLMDNPLVETYTQVNPFSNPMSEAIYRRGQQPEKTKSAWQSIKQLLREIRKGFRGDFPLLAGQEAKEKGLTAAREILRIMNRNTDAKSHAVMVSLYDSLHGLNSEQFDIFSRLMLVNDIYAFKKNNPNADLPMEFTPQSLKADRDYLVSLARKDKKILNALLTENENNKKARQDLVNLANELSFASLAKRLQSTDLFLIQYADILREAELGTNDFYTNYVIAIGKMRTTMLQDLERLLAIKKLKEKGYDKKAELIRKYGNAKRGKIAEWKYHIPKGYSIFNPLSGQFIQSAHSLTENVIGIAFEENCRTLGLSNKTISMLQTKFSDKFGTQLMVLPDEITQTLSKLSTPNVHDPLYKFAKKLTNYWKKYVLYFPTRVWKYNLRNITGDLDAALAGDPTMVRFFPQAFSELTTAFYGDKTKISNELKEFQARGGALTFRSAQDLLEDRQFKEASKLIADLNAKGNSAWKNLPRNAWKLLDKFLGSGVQKFSDFREQWIRYAVYLDYLHQMQNNNGIPNNWGASDKDEVMSIDDIRDRAFKMANELIGAYDQISETGRALRDLLIPFYSWMEVNAKRYLQLLYNGLAEEEIGDFAQRFLKGQIANIPYYTYKVGKTLFFINLFSILVQAFNNFFWPDDEEKLPPEIRERPHLVFGHDSEGNVLYFRDVGSLFDLVDWFGLDTFKHDVKQIFNGQQTVTDWLKHISSAPFAKLVNGLTPLIKTPIELLSGQSYYPDVTNPRQINDRMQYLAQSFGLTWPLKFAKHLVNGYSYSNWQEFRNLFIYAQDAEQAAYFYTLNLVRQFRENVLGEKFSGYSTSKRTQALRDFKTALRFNDKNAAVRSLHDYYSLDGTDNGLKTSMRNMHPLHSLNDKNKQRFLQWISEEDRAFIQRAEAYYSKQLKRYDDALKEFNATKSNNRQRNRSY